jgi:hypothetical protein
MSIALICGVELLLDTKEGTLLDGSEVVCEPTSKELACWAKIEGSPSMAIWTVDGVTFEIDLLTLGFCTLAVENPVAELETD